MSEDKTFTKPLETTKTSEPAAESARRIGHYRLLQKLGEGGMGEVWLAQQEEPVRRRVALKLIKLGMDTKQVIARFEAERQALAIINHPNVAKVFDAGTTPQGRPYFAMEYVKGESITKYSDRQRLSTTERLRLFIRVCEGVQHAHQKGIIHRDIKPSNVLVQVEGDEPVPKIIDFGVAKAMEHRLTEKTVFTQMGVLIGTPEYMSPEQAEMSSLDIDTRTDVYSLGMVLYELLVGLLPFDPKRLRQDGFDEIRRKIREDEPSRPSTRLSASAEASAESAKHRRTDVSTLKRQLRGDLDSITMKALEKDRTRRYGSPNELADDINRHLRHEPVLASPPSYFYRTGKFVRRNRGVVAFVALIFLFLVGFAVRERIQATRLSDERDRATQEAETAAQVSDFLVGLFAITDPKQARGNEITAREVLDRGAARIRHDLSTKPRVKARLMAVIGNVYRGIGSYDEARTCLEDALGIRTELLGEDHRDTADSMNDLGQLFFDLGNYEQSLELYTRALDTWKKTLPSDHPSIAVGLNNTAMALRALGKYEEAKPLFEASLKIVETAYGSEDARVAQSLNNYASLLWSMEEPRLSGLSRNIADARRFFERALAIRERVLGADHPELAEAYSNYGSVLLSAGEEEQALQSYERALAIRETVFGSQHVEVANSLHSIGFLYESVQEYADARGFYERALAVREASLGKEDTILADWLERLARVSVEEGDVDQAVTHYSRALRIWQGELGSNNKLFHERLFRGAAWYLVLGRHTVAELLYDRAWTLDADHDRETAEVIWVLATALLDRGNSTKAQKLYERALEIERRVEADNSARLAARQARYYSIFNDREKAIRFLRQAVAQGSEHDPITEQDIEAVTLYVEAEPTLADIRGWRELFKTADALLARSLFPDAQVAFQQILSIQERELGHAHLALATTLRHLAACHRHQRRYTEAEELLRRALDIRKTADSDHPDMAQFYSDLGSVFFGQGRYEDAMAEYSRALTIHESVLDAFPATCDEEEGRQCVDAHVLVGQTLDRLALCYLSMGKQEEATKAQDRALEIKQRVLGPDHPATIRSLYDRACVVARTGDDDGALTLLRTVVAHGYNDVKVLTDERLSSLREGAEFETILDTIRTRVLESAGDRDDTLALLEEHDISNPVLLKTSKVPLAYPALARVAGITGDVVVVGRIQPDGRIDDTAVRTCNRPNMGFEETAIQALKQWDFIPARREQVPVPARVEVRFAFRLDQFSSFTRFQDFLLLEE